MKWCFKCRETKPRAEFFRNRSRRDGYADDCKVCSVANAKAFREKNPAYDREYDQRNPDRRLAKAQKWASKHAERIRIMERGSRAVQQAVRVGRLTRPDQCEECHTLGRVEGAHFNYTELLRVRWLCRRCHNRWDREEPKTLSAA